MDESSPVLATVQPNEEKSSSGWHWFLIILLVLAIAAAVVFLILWLTKSEDKKELSISGVNFKVSSSTSITATWTTTGNDKDEVTLYASPTGSSLDFDPTGKPVLTPVLTITPVFNSSTVPASQKTVTVTGLATNTTYDAVLIVTNPDIKDDYGTSKFESGLHTSTVIPNKFFIQSTAGGYIAYTPKTGPMTVGYETSKLNVNHVLFHYQDGTLCTTTQIGTPSCGDNSYVLYNDSNKLGIKQQSSIDSAEKPKALWDFDATTSRWCVRGDTSLCMTAPITPVGTSVTFATLGAVTPLNPITLGTSGTKWKNIEFGAN